MADDEKLYPTKEGPRYLKGHGVTLALVAFAVVLYGCMSAYFSKANRGRRNGEEDPKIAGMSDDEIDELGDRSPRYVYTV